jgi:hypothetical protein
MASVTVKSKAKNQIAIEVVFFFILRILRYPEGPRTISDSQHHLPFFALRSYRRTALTIRSIVPGSTSSSS